MTFCVFKAPTVSLKQKPPLLLETERLRQLQHNQKKKISPPSLTIPLFTLCPLVPQRGPIPASIQLNFNVNVSIICTLFILDFLCIVSASVPAYKVRGNGGLYSLIASLLVGADKGE